MSDIAIRCEGLSKQYRIGKRERYQALRDVLTDGLSAPFRHFRSSIRNSKSEIRNSSSLSAPFRALGSALPKGSSSTLTPNSEPRTPNPDSFWALKDVGFEVKHGEVVGIIGRNGAGKSTLLKILSRITEPTRGFAEINGRVGSLLEVGTGFHPELTGRENVYLNGAILGMKRAEIDRRFDEIVAFAETEKFLDTPVKHYSSGMQMRLAFAVAAHLEPEILLIDEVLAVGDIEFQKRCLGKLSEVAHSGRTVLFVSHNMSAVRSLCQRGLILENGTKQFDGETIEAVKFYTSHVSITGGMSWVRPGFEAAEQMIFEEIKIVVGGEQPRLTLLCDITIRCHRVCASSFVAVDICDSMLTPIMQALPEAKPFIVGTPGLHRLRLEVELPPLIPGIYRADFWIGPHYTATYDYLKNALSFEIIHGPSRSRSFPHSPDHGCVVPACRYNYVALSAQEPEATV